MAAKSDGGGGGGAGGRLRPAAQPGRGGGGGGRGGGRRRRRRGGRAGRQQLPAHLPLLQHLVVLLGLPERLPAEPAGAGGGPGRRRRRGHGPAGPGLLLRGAAALPGGARRRRRGRAAVAGLPVDRAGAAGAAGGRGHGPVAGAAPLRAAGLRVVRPDPGLRAAALRAGADPQLPLVRAGLHGRRAGRRAGPQQPRAAHDGRRRAPAGGRRHPHAGGPAPLQALGLGLAGRHPPAADGTGLEGGGGDDDDVGWRSFLHREKELCCMGPQILL
ncbi:unnamed protein product, partial [Eretmochelys imbricata]